MTVFNYTPVNAKQFDGLNIDGPAGKHQKRENFPLSKFCAIRYYILLAQLITTLMHCTFTVPLQRLTDWFAFRVSSSDHVNSQLRQWDSWKHYMEGMGLKFTAVVVRCLLGPLNEFGPIWLAVLGSIASQNTPNKSFNPPPAAHPPPPPILILYPDP